MFEFDEHYNELEAFNTLLAPSSEQDDNIAGAWLYLGHDVWKVDFVEDAFMPFFEWSIETADVA